MRKLRATPCPINNRYTHNNSVDFHSRDGPATPRRSSLRDSCYVLMDMLIITISNSPKHQSMCSLRLHLRRNLFMLDQIRILSLPCRAQCNALSPNSLYREYYAVVMRGPIGFNQESGSSVSTNTSFHKTASEVLYATKARTSLTRRN